MAEKLILVHPPSKADALMFHAEENDSGDAPWIALRNSLRGMGYTILTTWEHPRLTDDVEWLLVMNVPRGGGWGSLGLHGLLDIRRLRRAFFKESINVWKLIKLAIKKNRVALFLWEPEVVMPENYLPKMHVGYTKVFTWASDLVQKQGPYTLIRYPQASGYHLPENPRFHQRKLMANFSGNKASSHSNELYSARVQTIRYMEENFPEQFDHYGPGWSKDYPSWRGTVESKFDVYPNYRFGLCYENMRYVNGYITEKIFDCLRAGTVPVYWGAPDIADYVDPCAFVDRANFTSDHDMLVYLNQMDEATWLSMRQAGQAYLKTSTFEKFLPEAFCNTIINSLGLKRDG